MIESIPNVSEGQRPAVLEALTATLRAVPGLRLLDRSADAAHHRAVFTVAGEADTVEAAALALVGAAVSLVDLRTHRGVHPRMGAVDVLPFVPLDGATMADCIELARRAGAAIADRYDLPVYLYEAAATRPERRRLEHVRRGQFEGLAARFTDPAWAPDFGPARPHPTAGAIAIGARQPLIAYNINLDSDRLDIARAIAASIRERDGGLPAVKALGLPLTDRGIVQVSMNLTDFTVTPPAVVFRAVEQAAARAGVRVRESELIGLIPRAALHDTTADALRLTGFRDDQILEERIARTPPNPPRPAAAQASAD